MRPYAAAHFDFGLHFSDEIIERFRVSIPTAGAAAESRVISGVTSAAAFVVHLGDAAVGGFDAWTPVAASAAVRRG